MQVSEEVDQRLQTLFVLIAVFLFEICNSKKMLDLTKSANDVTNTSPAKVVETGNKIYLQMAALYVIVKK